MKIITDLDDVIAETTDKLISEANKNLGTKLTSNEIYPISKHPKEVISFFKECVNNPSFYEDLNKVKGLKYLENIEKDGTHISIVTGRPENARGITLDWLAQNDVPYDNLILTDYLKNQTKDKVIKELSPDLVIEDSPDLILKTIERANGGNLNVGLFRRPWTLMHLEKLGYKENPKNVFVTLQYSGDAIAWQEMYKFYRRLKDGK